MVLKPDAQDVVIKEQIVEDLVTGLTFQFQRTDSGYNLHIFGENLPFGNRTIMFDKNGEESGGGTGLERTPEASWLRSVSKERE